MDADVLMGDPPAKKRLRSKTPSRPEDPNSCEVCRDAYPDTCHCTAKVKNLSSKASCTFVDENGRRRPWLRIRPEAGVPMVGCFLCANFMGAKTPHPKGKLHKFGFKESDRHFSVNTINTHNPITNKIIVDHSQKKTIAF